MLFQINIMFPKILKILALFLKLSPEGALEQHNTQGLVKHLKTPLVQT